MEFGQNCFREIDLFDLMSFSGLDFFKFSGPLCICLHFLKFCPTIEILFIFLGPPGQQQQPEPEIQAIRLKKANGGMGLSIVAAKGIGKDKLGIYVKAVVDNGAAYHDGRLQPGDQVIVYIFCLHIFLYFLFTCL